MTEQEYFLHRHHIPVPIDFKKLWTLSTLACPIRTQFITFCNKDTQNEIFPTHSPISSPPIVPLIPTIAPTTTVKIPVAIRYMVSSASKIPGCFRNLAKSSLARSLARITTPLQDPTTLRAMLLELPNWLGLFRTQLTDTSQKWQLGSSKRAALPGLSEEPTDQPKKDQQPRFLVSEREKSGSNQSRMKRRE